MVSVCLSALQLSITSAAVKSGELNAPATLAASIGLLNATVIAAVRSTPVAPLAGVVITIAGVTATSIAASSCLPDTEPQLASTNAIPTLIAASYIIDMKGCHG